MMYGIFGDLVEGVNNFVRSFFWDVISAGMDLINELQVALFDGVLSFGILENTYVQEAYKASLVIMFIILPSKLIYEIVFAMVRDDEGNLDIGKKVLGALTGVMVAVSLSTVLPLLNNLSINSSKVITGSIDGSDYGNELIISVMTGFGGMDRNNVLFTSSNGGIDIGAENFVKLALKGDIAMEGMPADPGINGGARSSNSFSGTERWELYDIWDPGGDFAGDSDFGTPDDGDLLDGLDEAKRKAVDTYMRNHEDEYVWNFNYLGTLIGLAIFIILLFIIVIEVAGRMIEIGFYFAIGPLCCMSLTNFQNPQAFTVWKNSIIGNFLMNTTQVFLLMLLGNIAGDIAKQNIVNHPLASAVAQLALYFGAFSATIALPKYVQAMIGGYGAGMMESMQQLKGAVGAAWGLTGGAAMGLSRKVMGRHNDFTGHLTGGLRGKLFGNKQSSGQTVGGVKGMKDNLKDTASNAKSSIFGKEQKDAGGKPVKDEAGNTVRSGGLAGAARTVMNGTKSGQAVQHMASRAKANIKGAYYARKAGQPFRSSGTKSNAKATKSSNSNNTDRKARTFRSNKSSSGSNNGQENNDATNNDRFSYFHDSSRFDSSSRFTRNNDKEDNDK